MEHDQEMYAQHGLHDNPYHSSVYSSDILSFQTPSSFLISQHSRQRFPPSDIAFRSHNHHHHHEAEHVYNSPQLTLDPSTLDLRPSTSDDISISSSASSSANTGAVNNTATDSSSSTPTGSLRISTYNSNNNNNHNNHHTLPPPSGSPTTATPTTPGVLTRRKHRVALEQLQIPTQPTVHTQSSLDSQQHQHNHHSAHSHSTFPSSHNFQSRLHHRTSDMHDVQMQHGELHMHVDDQPLIDSIHHQSNTLTPHAHVYPILSDTSTASRYYLSPDTFPNSPATVSSPADVSPPPDLQPISPTSTLASSPTSTVPLARSFRSGSLSLGLTANRSLSLITSLPTSGSVGQPISPSHVHGPQLSSHPHMHPTPYYINHGPGSPIYPSTPPTSHHTQTSSSSSRSSGQTHYSLRGSPAPHAFGRGHGRSNSYGTGSTMSVRSTSPASSVTSALTSLSGGGGGGGSTPSTSGHLGSPISYGENTGDAMQMPFSSSQDTLSPHSQPPPPTPHFPRAQSHPPTIIPNYPSHHHHHHHHHHPQQHRKSHLAREPYAVPRNNNYIDGTASGPSRDSLGWPNMMPDVYIHTGTRLTDEEFQAQFPPKPLMTRAPHRKQKLANSDRKAICMYAKQHPSARQEDIAARYNVERSTISKILKNKERWLGCPDDDAKVARKRKPRFDDLELVLKLWVEDARPQKIVLSDALIRSKAKEEARRLGIHEDKFKASSGWLENFKHRVGIRKGKYIGRDHWQEGSESDFDDPNSQRFQAQKANWSKHHQSPNDNSKDSWDLSLMGSTSPLKETSSMMQLSVSGDSSGKHHQSGFPSEELNIAHSSPQVLDARPGSRHENNHVGPVMRKTRSRTLAENKDTAAASTSASTAALPNSLNPSASSTIESRAATISSSTSSSSVPAIQMDAAFLLRPHDTSHSIAEEDSESRKSNSPIGRQSESRGASEAFGAALNSIGSQGFMTNQRV